MPLSDTMRHSLGMTIAIWFPGSVPAERMSAFLRRTLDDVELFVRPENLLLVVDGCPAAVAPTQRAAEEVQSRSGVRPRVEVKQHNEGQGGAVAFGIERLLADTHVQYLSTRDADGDRGGWDTILETWPESGLRARGQTIQCA